MTRFANFRSGLGKRRNRCEPCGCRTRSHFFFLDDYAVYTVDTGGVIWYQAPHSFEWKRLYRCRNYIPWSNGVSRLDHVLRDASGRTGGQARYSLRIPCGRPESGSFIGFQTDTNSCVIFRHGELVYEGAYRSDCSGYLTFGNTEAFFGYSLIYGFRSSKTC